MLQWSRRHCKGYSYLSLFPGNSVFACNLHVLLCTLNAVCAAMLTWCGSQCDHHILHMSWRKHVAPWQPGKLQG